MILMSCSGGIVGGFVYIAKRIVNIIWIIGPILAIVSLIYNLTMMLKNPDDEKTPKKIKNSVMALIILFFIPLLVNVAMQLTDNNISACWKSANSGIVINTKYKNPYGDDPEKTKTIFTDSDKYEKGDKRPFNLEHAIKVHDNIHRKENTDLPWHNDIVGHCGGSIGAYTEAVNIFNEKDYRIYEVYAVLTKRHPELITTNKEPHTCKDVNDYYNIVATEIKPTIKEMRKALDEGCLVQKIANSNKWRDDKGKLKSWPGFHWGLIFYYDGKYYHMKAAGNLDQSDSIYTESQLKEWLSVLSWNAIKYCKKK